MQRLLSVEFIFQNFQIFLGKSFVEKFIRSVERVYVKRRTCSILRRKIAASYVNRKPQVEYLFVTCDNEGGACHVCQIAAFILTQVQESLHRAGDCYFSGLYKQRLHAG